MSDKVKKGLIFALLTATISGFAIFYNKVVIMKGVDPQVFNILRNGGVAAVLTASFLFSGKVGVFRRLSLRDIALLIVIGVVGGGIPFILYFDGLRSVAAINANLIHKSMFLWISLLAVPFLKERISQLQILGYGLILASNFVIGGFGGFAGNSGELFILLATLLWSLEHLIAKVALRNLSPSLVAWGRMTIGLIVILTYAYLSGKLELFRSLSLSQIGGISGSIILLTGYVVSWYKALKLAPITLVSSVLILATPITNILTAIFITHTFPLLHVSNVFLSVLGVVLITVLGTKFPKPIQMIPPPSEESFDKLRTPRRCL